MAWRGSYDNNIESDVSGVVSFPLLQSLARHNNSVLSKIEQKEWSILSSIGAVARCAKGEYVLRAGETPSFVGILLQGVLCEQRGDNDEGAVHSKKEFTAAERRLGKGSMLDPNSFFSHQQSAATAKRTFSLVAEQAVMVFVLPYTALQALYTPLPHLYARIVTALGIACHLGPVSPEESASAEEEEFEEYAEEGFLDADDAEAGAETLLGEREMEGHRPPTVVLDGGFGDCTELKFRNDTLVAEIEVLRSLHHDMKATVRQMQATYDELNADYKIKTKEFFSEKKDRDRYIKELEDDTHEQKAIKQSYNSILKWVLIKRYCKAHREKGVMRALYFKLVTASTECLAVLAEHSPAQLLSVQGFDLDTLETRVRRRVTAWPWVVKRARDKLRKDSQLSMIKQMDAESVLIGECFSNITKLMLHWKTSCNQLFKENVVMKRTSMESDEMSAKQTKLRKLAQLELAEQKRLTKKLTWKVEKAARDGADWAKRESKTGGKLLGPGHVPPRQRKDHARSELSAENQMLFSRGVELKRRVVALEASIGLLQRREQLMKKQRSDMELGLEAFLEEQRLIEANSNSKIPYDRPSTMALPYLKRGGGEQHSSEGMGGLHVHPQPPPDAIGSMTREGRRTSVRKASSARRPHKSSSSSSNSSSSSLRPPSLQYNLSFALLMPDIVGDESLRRAVLKRFAEEDFQIIEQRVLRLSLVQAETMNGHIHGQYLGDMCEFMTSGPVMGLCLRKQPECVGSLQRLVGPQSIEEAKQRHPVSLRAKFGTSDMQGAVYCSVSKQQSARDIELFFGHFEDEFDEDNQHKVIGKVGALELLQEFRAVAAKRKAKSKIKKIKSYY